MDEQLKIYEWGALNFAVKHGSVMGNKYDDSDCHWPLGVTESLARRGYLTAFRIGVFSSKQYHITAQGRAAYEAWLANNVRLGS